MGPFSFRFGGVFFHFHDGRKGRFGSISKGSKLDIITFNSTMKALVKGEEWQRALSSMDSPVGSVLWGFGMVFCRGFNVGIHQVLRGSRGGGYGYCLKFSWFGNTWIHSWIYIYIYIFVCWQRWFDKGLSFFCVWSNFTSRFLKSRPKKMGTDFFNGKKSRFDPISWANFWVLWVVKVIQRAQDYRPTTLCWKWFLLGKHFFFKGHHIPISRDANVVGNLE